MKVVAISDDLVFLDELKKRVSMDIVKLHEDEVSDFSFSQNDVVLFDIDELEDVLNSVLFKAKVFCIARNLDELKGYRLLKKGAKGYDSLKTHNLETAIKTLQDEQVWIYPKLMSFIIKNSTISAFATIENPIDKLSKKELQVAKLVSQGLTNFEIASSLDITVRTVKAHVSSCFNKLTLKDRVALAMLVKEHVA